jgi:hypothetical protein
MAENLIVVPKTPDVFRTTVSALQSLDDEESVSCHNLSLPEDSRVRLLVKKIGKLMPESTVQEEYESLNIRAQGVVQFRSGRRVRGP